MPENEQDSGQAAGSQGSPNSATSQAQGVQQGSFDAVKMQNSLDALIKRQDEIDARTRSLQGDKDRDVKKTRKELEEIKRQFAEIEKMKNGGMELDDAVEEVDFRQTVRELKDQISKLNPVSAQPAGNATSGAEETAKVLAEYKLDGNDVEVIPLLTLTGEKLEAAAAKLAYRRASSTQPSATSSTVLSGGNSATNTSVDKLLEDYKKNMRAARGKPAELRAIKAKFLKQGVDVWSVDLS